MHHGRSAPPCCPSYDVPRPPSVESSNFPTASDQRSDPPCGPSPWTSRPLSSGTPTFSMLSHGSSNTPRSSSAAPRPHSAVSSTLVMPSCGFIDTPCGPSSVAPRLLPTVASTAHHQRSAAFCGPSSAVPLPLSVMPPTLPTEYHGCVDTLCEPSPEEPRPPRLTYSFEHLNSYRDSVVSKQCNRDVRKRLFKLHLWTSNRESLHKNCSGRFDKSSISLQHSRNYVSFSLINARSVCNKITYLRDYRLVLI